MERLLIAGFLFNVRRIHAFGKILVGIDSCGGLGKQERNAPATATALRKGIVGHGKNIMRQTMLIMAGCVDAGDRHSVAGSEGPSVHSPRFPPETIRDYLTTGAESITQIT
jgi:hypothetical protein